MSTPNGTVHDHNGTVYEGASPKDRLFRASSGNETGLFEEILEEFSDAEKRIEFLNESRDFSGNTALHLAALNGSCHLLDKLLKAADIEVNPLNSSGNTPLHVAVEYYAAHCDSYEGHIRGLGIVEMLLEQKADPRIQNNNNNKRPIDLIDLSDPGKTELRELLEDGIEAIEADEAEKAKDAEAKKAKEAEKAKEVEKAEEADKAKEAEKAEKAEKAKEAEKAEEAEKAKEAEKAEEADKAKEAEKAEEADKANEAKKAEKAKKAKDLDVVEESDGEDAGPGSASPSDDGGAEPGPVVMPDNDEPGCGAEVGI